MDTVTSRYSRLTHVTPNRKITSTHFAKRFLDNWILLYELLKYVLIDKGPQAIGKIILDAVPLVMGLEAVDYRLSFVNQR